MDLRNPLKNKTSVLALWQMVSGPLSGITNVVADLIRFAPDASKKKGISITFGGIARFYTGNMTRLLSNSN
jgi:hypothetical protein